MIIDSSSIQMSSTHKLLQEYRKDEELAARSSQSEVAGEEDRITLSEKALHRLEKDLAKALKHLEKNIDKMDEDPERDYGKALRHLARDLGKAIRHIEKDDDSNDIREINVGSDEATQHGLVKRLVEEFTGRRIHLKGLNELPDHGDDQDDADEHDDPNEIRSEYTNSALKRWDIKYSMSESYHESEQLSFNSGGIIRTADGRSIYFSLDLMMSREHLSERHVSLEAEGITANSIMVNFDGPASELSHASFDFGVDQEDDAETLSYLALGSGLVSLDLNNNGAIDSLNEIVGTSSGSGFDSLGVHDEDGNGWIDENDTVYNNLSIYSQDGAGNDVLSGLKESNIGAIYLGNVDSPFALKNEMNTLLGQIEKSGIYLNEDGTPGIVQQLSIIV